AGGDGSPGWGETRSVERALRLLRSLGAWLPDVVVLLDLAPQAAFERITARGRAVDRHENEADLAQARAMYLALVEPFRATVHPGAAHVVDVEDRTPGEVLRAVVEVVRSHLPPQQPGEGEDRPLGT